MNHPPGIYIIENSASAHHFYQILRNLGLSSEEVVRSAGPASDIDIVFKEAYRQVIECIDTRVTNGIEMRFLVQLQDRPDMRYLRQMERLQDPARLKVFKEAVHILGVNTYTLIDREIGISCEFDYFMEQVSRWRLVVRKTKG